MCSHLNTAHMEVKVVIYFDNNATAAVTDSVKRDLRDALSNVYGNPSSAHAAGNGARAAIERARVALAELVGADPGEIQFTSGATEANNCVVKSAFDSDPGPQIVSTRIEHPSILSTLDHVSDRGCSVRWLKLAENGQVQLDDLSAALFVRTSLVTVQWVNSETGIVQPVREIAELCKRHSVPLHVDGAQAVGRVEMDLRSSEIDFLSLSGHKFHAPPGIGALYIRDRRALVPLLHGGGQEHGSRAGTENWLGIIGLGGAARDRKARFTEVTDRLLQLCTAFEEEICSVIPDVEIVGRNSQRVGNTSNIRFPGIDGQALVAQLSQKGLMCSQGSACHNYRPEPSHVLRALGYTEKQAYECVRFSFSELNNLGEIGPAVDMISACVSRLRLFAGKGI